MGGGQKVRECGDTSAHKDSLLTAQLRDGSFLRSLRQAAEALRVMGRVLAVRTKGDAVG